MQLREIEEEIKIMINEDVNNPEIFNKIYNLIYFYFLRRHLFDNKRDASEVALPMAEDLYTWIRNKPDLIHSWLGYISKICPKYIGQWRKEQKSEIIDTDGDEELSKSIIRMCASSSIDNCDIEEIYNKNYLDNLPKIINKVINGSKYYPDSSQALNARISLFLSIANNKYVPFGSSLEENMYNRMLYRIVSDIILSDMNFNYSDNSLTLLQLFVLEDNISED